MALLLIIVISQQTGLDVTGDVFTLFETQIAFLSLFHLTCTLWR
jgi:hypothetical protein